MNNHSVDALDALSDEFHSTFTETRPGVLMNLFHEDERPVVEALVKKHMGAKSVTFTKMDQFKDEAYAGWIIRWK